MRAGIGRRGVLAGALLWTLAPALLWLSLHRPFAPSQGRAAALPARLGGFTLVDDYALTPRHLELLGTADAVWRTYRDGRGREVVVVLVHHGANWKSVHPPHLCIEGSNMTIRSDGRAALPGGGEAGRILAWSHDQQRLAVNLYAYGARGLVTPSYARFVLHHAPRALFRAATAGFLIRVAAWADGEDAAAGEALCAEFLTLALPAATEVLP